MTKKLTHVFQSIQAVSYCVHNYDASLAAARSYFGYQLIESGELSKELANSWNAPAMSGYRFCILQASSGADFYLRFIEAPKVSGYAPLLSYGWNATELLVQDVHGLSEQLRDSDYTIIGGPRDLLNDGTAIALQVRGPSDEIFYLTEINGQDFQGKYGTATCKVDRAFIAVLGTHDQKSSLDFYRPFSSGLTESRELGIRVLANAHGLDPLQSKFEIASAILENQFRIEIDTYPDSAIVRPKLVDQLPPGLCMVSIKVASVGEFMVHANNYVSDTQDSAPYFGNYHSLISGVNGELIELIGS